ncbi:Protein translocase subunit SecD [Sinobacterium norvegicum]|uniref:Protein translocase subunit SecD n=2 Tax=Sinobacterium norvegicum TaxID=1641715 RepID=A0ABN8ECJ4_9GAMM|nr:Protein translocase subunit SecD [Sinobacterium norvegicum]
MSPWKYGLLIFTLIITALSALPSWYGENAAVLIGHAPSSSPNVVELQQLLQADGVEVKHILQQGDETRVILVENTQQSEARATLQQFLPHTDTLSLAMVPAAPAWLTNLGFSPIKLGLDLRGGVQLLLEVDVDEVYRSHSQQLADNLRQQFRGQGLAGNHVGISGPGTLELKLRDAEAKQFAQQWLAKDYPQWQARAGNGDDLKLSLRDEERTNIRNLTVEQNLQTMRSRIEQLGITEALVQRQGEARIRIELPGVQDPAAAKSVIGATASLAFYQLDEHGSEIRPLVLQTRDGDSVRLVNRPVLTGDSIIDARSGIGEYGRPEVNITLDGAGGRRMSDFSSKNIGKPMATAFSEYSRDSRGNTVKNSEVINVATIQSALAHRFVITGLDSVEKSRELALLLRAGSLTAPVSIIEERTIGPSLGAENIENGMAALALGMSISLLFMGLWYRRLGWVANLALSANLVMLLGLMALIPGAVLTLPGIAGLVLTIGMAIDTNVLIFERIKDRLEKGKRFAVAIDQGFNSAFATILDANITTLITAAILYWIGNGPIQGFALTLGLGLLTSMFTGVFASRALINLAYGRNSDKQLRV